MRIPDKVMMEYEEEKWLGPTTSQSSSETEVRLHFHCLWRFNGIICRRVVSGKGVASGERWRYVSPPPPFISQQLLFLNEQIKVLCTIGNHLLNKIRILKFAERILFLLFFFSHFYKRCLCLVLFKGAETFPETKRLHFNIISTGSCIHKQAITIKREMEKFDIQKR